jgi:hypothetical protein
LAAAATTTTTTTMMVTVTTTLYLCLKVLAVALLIFLRCSVDEQ